MSPVKTIKTFRDLLSFLTIIPLGGKEDFIFTTAENVWLFPLIGGFIGVLAALYFSACSIIVAFLCGLANGVVALPVGFLDKLLPAAMTVAFLLVITGLQHFDGLIDLGNAIGHRNLHDRKMVAHAWTVTNAGAVLALAVEFVAFAGLFYVDPLFAISAIIASEVAAKLAMVTIVWVGKPSHKGLGSIFLSKAKKNINAVAYIISILISMGCFVFAGGLFLGLVAVGIVLVSVPVAFIMRSVSNSVFGGVSGDMIGATNEVARASALVLFSVALWAVML
jgi:adenosylcobinamide-GDP ribazoletransferase